MRLVTYIVRAGGCNQNLCIQEVTWGIIEFAYLHSLVPSPCGNEATTCTTSLPEVRLPLDWIGNTVALTVRNAKIDTLLFFSCIQETYRVVIDMPNSGIYVCHCVATCNENHAICWYSLHYPYSHTHTHEYLHSHSLTLHSHHTRMHTRAHSHSLTLHTHSQCTHTHSHRTHMHTRAHSHSLTHSYTPTPQ